MMPFTAARKLTAAALLAAVFAPFASASVIAAPAFVDPVKPAKQRVAGAPVNAAPPATGEVQVPVITWGGDAATIQANGGMVTTPASAFGKAGLNLKLVKQDDPTAQVKDYMAGKSPFLRGTMGMVNTWSEALAADPRTKPVVVMQLTWSTGGDCLVTRGTDIAGPKDLKGKTIVLQQYGPHVEYMDQVLTDAGLKWSDVTIKWCEELYDLNGKTDDPAKIMREDPSIDAIFCISPDAAALTSNFKTGTGAEGSVKGARVLLSTKSAGRVIADVYAVRKDFLDANRAWVEKFVKTHMAAQQAVTELLRKDGSPEYAALVKLNADKLLDNPEALNDMKGLLADCTFALEGGNTDFFANKGNLTGFEPTVKRNQTWLVTQGYVAAQQTVTADLWTGKGAVATGDTGAVTAAAPRVAFKREAAQKVAAEAGDSSTLFSFEILFAANQNDFNAAQYGDQFQRALQLAATYSGAVLEIVGHSDPYRYLRMKIKDKASDDVLARQAQSGLNLSLNRGNAVRDSLMAYAKGKGITFNETQFITNGKGYNEPKVSNPQSEDDLAKNRRVVFRIINIESESDSVFEPLGPPTPAPAKK